MLFKWLMRLEEDSSLGFRERSDTGAAVTIALSFFLKQGYD